MANFDPQDGGAVIAGNVLWLSAQGDPYATTSTNPGGAFTSAASTKTAKDGDYIARFADLSGTGNNMEQATDYRKPIYRNGNRNGPYLEFNPPNSEYDYIRNPVRARISDISATTGQLDIYTATYNIIRVGGVLPGGSGGTKAMYLYGMDSGWAYLTTPAVTTAFDWVAADAVGWYDNVPTAKQAIYTGVAEGMAYLDGPSAAISSAGGTSVYVVCRSMHTATGSRATWFSHGNAGSFAFGQFPNGSSTPKLNCFINGNQRVCTTLSASHSPQIYSVRADSTNAKFSMGDQTETVTNATSVPTASATYRLGQYSPNTTNQWYGAGHYYAVLVFNVKLSDADHARVLAYLRSVHDIQEPTGLLSVVGYSIFSGYNASPTPFWTQIDAEQQGFEMRVNAYPGITQSTMRTNVLASTGAYAFTAPYVTQSNYKRKWAILAGLTNDYTTTPNNVPAAMTALNGTIGALQGQGHNVILTTDVDKYTGTAQWRTDANIGNPLIRGIGLPVIDWAANNRMGRAGGAQDQMNFYAGYVHPNETGQKIMAKVAESKLVPLLSNSANGIIRRRKPLPL